VPGTVTRGELRRLALQRERAELDVKVMETEKSDQKTLRALNIRGVIVDLELAELEIEWAQVTSDWGEVQRLEPARQSAIRAIRLLEEVGPAAKEGVPALVAALGDPELERYARCALRRIQPAALEETMGEAISSKVVNEEQPESPAASDRHR